VTYFQKAWAIELSHPCFFPTTTTNASLIPPPHYFYNGWFVLPQCPSEKHILTCATTAGTKRGAEDGPATRASKVAKTDKDAPASKAKKGGAKKAKVCCLFPHRLFAGELTNGMAGDADVRV
jgi:hypothetical protein